MPSKSFTATDAEQTRAVGAALAAVLGGGSVVSLRGELGAGKTCLVQGACAALGVTSRVQSPSFVIVREYQGTGVRVAHVDVYRLDSVQELYDLGYEELFAPDRVVFVEWGDVLAADLPGARIDVAIERAENDSRIITIEAPDDLLEQIVSPS